MKKILRKVLFVSELAVEIVKGQPFDDKQTSEDITELDYYEFYSFRDMEIVCECLIPAFIESKGNNPELHEKIKDILIKEGIKVSSLIFNISSLRVQGGRFDSVKNDNFSRIYDYLERILLSLYNLSQNPEYDFHFKINPDLI